MHNWVRSSLRVATVAVPVALALVPVPGAAQAHQSRYQVRVELVAARSVTAAMVAAGTATGTWLYYLPIHGPSHPSLVVQLTRANGHALADVYDAPGNSDTVAIQLVRTHGLVTSVKVPASLRAAMTLQARGGWWERRGVPNFNLTIDVFGQIDALWEGPPPGRLPLHSQTTSVITGAGKNGAPVWDFRRLIPAFAGDGYKRANYAQRTCSTTPRREPSISVGWPYVATENATESAFGIPVTSLSPTSYNPPKSGSDVPGFTQAPGPLRPPILVDWAAGKITALSEIVSVRSASCGYDMYSIKPVRMGAVNSPDFESPWGFYNLSGVRTNLPNLIINAGYYPAGDTWLSQVTPAAAAVQLPNVSLDEVRYSWADHPGNGLFDYKVDLFGPRTYTTKIALAGGRTRVWAPSYATYPQWVIGHAWPCATFVDATHVQYPTSEGIYPWGSWPLQDVQFWAGITPTVPVPQFPTIETGLRGEYRQCRPAPTMLYVSSVDESVHLLYASGGMWNLKPHWTLSEANLTGGRAIDSWRLSHSLGTRTRTGSQVVDLRNYLMYTGPRGVAIRRSDRPNVRFTITPPTNRAQWQSFVRRVDPYRSGLTPFHMYSWVSRGKGGLALSSGARISSIQRSGAGMRFLLTIPRGLKTSGNLPGLHIPRTPGIYRVTYMPRGLWTVEPATSARVSVSMALPSKPQPGGVDANLIVQNAGDMGWHGSVSWDVAGFPKHHQRSLNVPGDTSVSILAEPDISPGQAVAVSVSLGNTQPVLLSGAQRGYKRPPERVLIGTGWTGTNQFVSVLVCLGGLLLVSGFLAVGVFGRRRV
jgi:hypothetical protein